MADYQDLIGKPFMYGGRGESHYDCYGLVMEMAARDGVELPDFGSHDNHGMIAAMMGSSMPEWGEIESRPGAVVLIRIGKYVSHVAYQVDQERMIHAWHPTGVSVIKIADWNKRIVGYYKYVGNKG